MHFENHTTVLPMEMEMLHTDYMFLRYFFCYSVHVSVSSIHTIHWYHIECNGILYTNKRKTAPCRVKQINESTSKRSITAQILCKPIMLLSLSDDKNSTVSPAIRIHFNWNSLLFSYSTRMDFISFAICLVCCFHIFRIEWEMPSDTLKQTGSRKYRSWGKI